MQRLHPRNGAITTLGLENGGEKGDKKWKATIALLRRSSIFQEGKKVFRRQRWRSDRAVKHITGVSLQKSEKNVNRQDSALKLQIKCCLKDFTAICSIIK